MQGQADALLEESAESKRERQEIIGVFEASKKALKIISEVDMKTKVCANSCSHKSSLTHTHTHTVYCLYHNMCDLLAAACE